MAVCGSIFCFVHVKSSLFLLLSRRGGEGEGNGISDEPVGF